MARHDMHHGRLSSASIHADSRKTAGACGETQHGRQRPAVC